MTGGERSATAAGDHLHDVIIVGGGIAGLAAAWRLSRHDIVVLEAADRPGGRIHSTVDQHGLKNFGAHMFGGPGSIVGDLCAELGLPLRPIDASLMGIAYGKRLQLKGSPSLLPFTLPLAPLARLSLARAGLRLRKGSAEAADMLRASQDLPWAEMTARRLAFGQDETLLQRLGKLHPQTASLIRAITERCGGDPAIISAGHGLRSFANVWSSSSPGFNLAGGSARLPEALAERLGTAVRLQTTVERVERHEGHVLIHAQDATGRPVSLRTKTAIVATQAPVTHSIANDLPDDTRAALAAVRYGPFLSVAINIREQAPGPLERSYAVSMPNMNFSVLFNQSVNRFALADHERGGSLMMFAGAARAEALSKEDDAKIASRALHDLLHLFPGSEIAGEPVVKRWQNGAPFAFPGRAALQPALTRPLERLALAGDYLEFPNMEAAIQSGYAAARYVGKWL